MPSSNANQQPAHFALVLPIDTSPIQVPLLPDCSNILPTGAVLLLLLRSLLLLLLLRIHPGDPS